MSDLEGPHFHTGMTSLARYVQYLFNLQQNTIRTDIQQRMCPTAYKESATTATREIERLGHENAILCSGACPPSEQDRKLNQVYRHLGNTEHGWNHTRMLLDIHLEHHVEMQDAELEERVEMITNLEQQLLELQV
jgi:hypothetical protein